jgi:hypothetical protein
MTDLDSIERFLMAENAAPLPKAAVQKWMKTDNITVMGAVFSLIHNPKKRALISPALDFTDYQMFHLKYYEQCIKKNPDDEWADSRYTAAHSLVSWFTHLWSEREKRGKALRQLKSLIKRLYLNQAPEIKTAIITGILEHLFRDSAIRTFFDDWKTAPFLRNAYEEGTQGAEFLEGNNRTNE